MSDRDKFIADMIAELGRQQKEDVELFNKPRSLTEKEVFQKMCFSFPIVSPEDIQKLQLPIDNIINNVENPLNDCFCLDSTFLENVINLSEKHENGSDSFAAQSIAALMFLKYPKYLLSCNKRKLSALFSKNVGSTEWSVPNNKKHDMSWQSIFASFRSLVMRSSSSLVSNLPAKVFVDESHLNALQSTISTFDQLVQLLSAAESTVVNTNKTVDIATSTKTDAEIETEFLSELDSDGNDNSLTLEEIFRKVVKEVLTVSTAQTASVSGSIVSMCKEMWLHCIFLYRDILIRMPVLIVAYLPPLCDVLLSVSNSSSGKSISTASNANADLFSFKPKSATPLTKPYPSSSECMFVMTAGNIATFLTAAPVTAAAAAAAASTSNPTATEQTNVQQMASSREAMRSMLTSKGRLTSLVDICERMSSGHTAVDKNSARSAVPSIDVESTTFLLDVCTLYTSDLKNGNYTYSSASSSGPVLSASKHFEALVTSRAAAILVEALVGCAKRATEWVAATVQSAGQSEEQRLSNQGGDASSRAAQNNLSALSSRLIRFFSHCALHSPLVDTYLLSSTDFLSALTSLNREWINLLDVLRTGGGGSGGSSSDPLSARRLDDTLGVFAPGDAVALLSVLLLTVTNSDGDAAVSELMFSLLQSATLLTSHFQLPLAVTPQHLIATSSGKSLGAEDYVVVEDASTPSDEVSVVKAVKEEEEAYTPEEVAEKESSVASGLSRHRYITRTAQRLAQSVELMASEADGANLVRALFRNKAPSSGSVAERTQSMLRVVMVRDVLKLTATQLCAISSIEEESVRRSDALVAASVGKVALGVEGEGGGAPPAPASTLPVVNVTAIRSAHEGLKKQLKALQSLIEGHASSKAD